jgi:two-component system, sensor histidine kinase PhcS
MDIPAQKIQGAFEQYERDVSIGNFKVACILGILLVPSFALLDFSLYPAFQYEFLAVRFGCSTLIAVFFTILLTNFGKKNYRFFTITLVLLPGSAICYMIFRTPEGAASPYYAGLNLVLLMTGFVLRWTFVDSMIATVLVTLEYLLACRLHGALHLRGVFVNNLFFMLTTAVIVVTGNFYYSKFRYREFAYRYQLDASKRELESTNTKLAEQNDALARANREIREAEAQLVQSERMATLGRLSVSLLHDIRNPLTFAKQALFNLQSKAQPGFDPAAHKQLAAIERGIERVEGIITPLYSFSHSASDAAEMLDLAEVLTTAQVFVSYELKDKNIAYEQHIAPGQTVFANRNQFISVIINLIENAAHALELKKFPEGEAPAIRVTGWVDERRSFVAIRDNGPGIPPDQRARLFRAFATTKKPGEGLGLGLNICYNNIQKAGGDLAVNTEVGKFCEFVINLPVDAAAAAAVSTAPAK